MGFDYGSARKHLLEIGACDRCIGRQFRRLFEGMDNGEIGALVRASETLSAARQHQAEKVILSEGCPLCNGHFLRVAKYAGEGTELIQNLDFDTFLVGARVEPALLGREEALWNTIGAENCEPLKKDIVRQAGLLIGAAVGKEVDFQRPDVTVLVDFTTGKVSAQAHPLFVYGEYRKLVRGIPQTKWFCRDCRGRGCKKCSFTGKMYDESVEELVAKVILGETGASGEKFHGSGREDIDATCLGWRPFVLELQEPVRRFLDWEGVAGRVNQHANGKVEVQSLRRTGKEEVRFLKAVKHDKSYEAIIECEGEPADEALAKIVREFTGKEIQQRTPVRVAHRRADLVRERIIHSVSIERAGKNRLRAVIKAAAGTYIKELISGDEGRTSPSFADFLGPCKCVELNVLEVHGNV